MIDVGEYNDREEHSPYAAWFDQLNAQAAVSAVLLQSRLTVDRCNGFRCSLTKKRLAGRVHAVSGFHPGGNGAQLIVAEWLRP